MAGWKQAERHLRNSGDSASLYGKYYHWMMMARVKNSRNIKKIVRKKIHTTFAENCRKFVWKKYPCVFDSSVFIQFRCIFSTRVFLQSFRKFG